MSHPNAMPGTPSNEPGAPYAVQHFPTAAIGRLSRDSFATHVELYEGYVREVNAIAAAAAETVALVSAPAHRDERHALARRYAFELNGALLHEWFFQQLGSAQVELPENSVLSEAMDGAFGGFDRWVADVKNLSEIRGPGWVVAFWDPEAEYLSNCWVDLHQLSVPIGQAVVFALDLWEHAYWTDFGPRGRSQYVDEMLRHTDWSVVADRVRVG